MERDALAELNPLFVFRKACFQSEQRCLSDPEAPCDHIGKCLCGAVLEQLLGDLVQEIQNILSKGFLCRNLRQRCSKLCTAGQKGDLFFEKLFI